MNHATFIACGAVFVFAICGVRSDAATSERFVQSEPDPVAWVNVAIQDASGDFSLGGYSCSFELQYKPNLTKAQLLELENRLRGLPDHPDRRILRREQGRAGGQSDELVTIWYEGPAQFRLGRTPVGNPIDATDIASRSGGVAWSMTQHQLTIVTPKTAPPGRDYSSTEPTVEYYLNFLLYGGLRFRDPDRIQVSLVPDTPNGLRVDVVTDFGSTVRLELARLKGEPLFDIVSRTVIDSEANPSEIGTSVLFEGWASVDWHEGRIPARVRFLRADGSVDEEWRLGPAKEWGSEAVQDLLAPPSATGVDPVRGEVKVSAVYDFRPGAMQLLERANAESEFVQTERFSRTRDGNMRLVGWGVLAGLAILFLALRYRVAASK